MARAGLSTVELSNEIETAETQLTNAVIATDLNPHTANPTANDIRLAIQNTFGSEASPTAITRFRSDFVIKFATPGERDLVASSEILYGDAFDMLLLRWSNRYGGKITKWQTEVAIDINGFPPHTFNPTVLVPLLSSHCSIQAYKFSEARGACRVDGYALNTRSIPNFGEVGVQYPDVHGVCNVTFPVALTAYPFYEAPEFQMEEYPANPAPVGGYAANPASSSPAHSIASYDTAEELGYDREVLQEAYEFQHRANQELQHARYRRPASPTNSSCSVSSKEPLYLLRDCSPASSFESDRSWHLY